MLCGNVLWSSWLGVRRTTQWQSALTSRLLRFGSELTRKIFQNNLHIEMEIYKEKLIDKTVALCENYVHNCSFLQFFTLEIF